MKERWGNSAVLGAIIVIAFGVFTGWRAQTAPPQDGFIDGPDKIVEFSSILTRTTSDRTLTGHFFRGPDGSSRHEQGPDLDHVVMVAIKNITEATYYVWDYRRPEVWVARPMLLGDGVPLKRRMPRHLLSPTNDPRPLRHEDFEVYQTERNGLVRRYAPALNFLEVDQLQPDGTRVTHTHILVGPIAPVVASLPAPRSGPGRDPLFDPPWDAQIEWHAEPGGIISGKVSEGIAGPAGRGRGRQ
jgi:hypothetical protein